MKDLPAIASANGVQHTAKSWKDLTGEELLGFSFFDEHLSDGARVATTSEDGTACTWDGFLRKTDLRSSRTHRSGTKLELLALKLCEKLRFQPEFQDQDIAAACAPLGVVSTATAAGLEH